MSESINGWTPPTIYDVFNDKTRIATQADIDRLERNLKLLREFYTSVTKQAREVADILYCRPTT